MGNSASIARVWESVHDHGEMAAIVQLFAMAFCHVTGLASPEDVAIAPYPHRDTAAKRGVALETTTRSPHQYPVGVHRCPCVNQVAQALCFVAEKSVTLAEPRYKRSFPSIVER